MDSISFGKKMVNPILSFGSKLRNPSHSYGRKVGTVTGAGRKHIHEMPENKAPKSSLER